jgi:hypothetical protein
MRAKLNNKPVKSAVDMKSYGINTVVLTEHKGLEAMLKRLESTPDASWAEGKGKAYMFQQLLPELQAEDRYFDANPKQAVASNARWRDFMDDCVILAVLGAVVHDMPLALMHPDNWDQRVKRSKNPFTPSQRPVLLPDVPVFASASR